MPDKRCISCGQTLVPRFDKWDFSIGVCPGCGLGQTLVPDGFDATQPPPGEPPELLADWMDETRTARGRGLAFCAPVRPGATEKGRAFAHQAYEARRDELAASRRAQGVTREVVTLNHTPMGDVVCVYVEGDDPVQGNKQFAESRSEFDVWFKDRCKEIFPPEVDFNEPLPAIAEIFDSQDVLVAR